MQTDVSNIVEKKLNIADIEPGDIFSEESHYVYITKDGENYVFKHLESKQHVNLDEKYVTDLLTTADQYNEIIKVGVEDKLWTQKQIDTAKKDGILDSNSQIRVGDTRLKGIRSIWSDIHTTKVFSVCFNKKGKELSKKAFDAAKKKQIDEALAEISTGKVTLEDAFKRIQECPINQIEKGDERVLRGYKVQFSSVNGYYDVIDMDIEDNGKSSNLRQVNINEINWLVVDGIKYVLE